MVADVSFFFLFPSAVGANRTRSLYMGWPVAFGRGIPGAAIMLATHTFASQKLGDYAAATTAPPPAAAAAVAAVAKRGPRTNRMD